MKVVILIVLLGALCGCATATYTHGRDFKSEAVASIERGKTTSADLVAMFGEPFSKAVISGAQEKWIYTYINTSSTAQSYLVTTRLQTTGVQKTLDVLIENGVVLNFTFAEGPVSGLNM